MTDLRSRLNHFLRVLASPLKTSNPLRQALARGWTWILNRTGQGIEVPVAGMRVTMLNHYRQLGSNYEADTLKIWTKLLQKGSTVWDVGANIGVYAIISSKLVGEQGEVQAWEPTPTSSDITRKHIALNRISNWCQVNQSAVGDRDGDTVRFGLVSEESTDPTNRLGSTQGKTIDVPMVTLDGELFRRQRRPNFVKIDIEGAEVFALRGAELLMTKQDARPLILLAVHPMFLPEFGCDAAELSQMIDQRNYSAFTTDGQPAATLEYAEYLLVPNEKVLEVKQTLNWC